MAFTLTPLPPIPTLDGCMFVDNSGWMESISMCKRLLEYRSLRNRIGAAEKPALNFGSAIHLCLEHRYKTYRHAQVDDAYYNDIGKILTQFFDEHPCPVDDWRDLNWAMETMRRYNEKYSIEDFALLIGEEGKPLVELSFVIELCLYSNENLYHLLTSDQKKWYHKYGGIRVIYTGKIDLPIYMDEAVWVQDHKSTSMLGDTAVARMKMSAQQKGYCWAFERLTRQKVMGYRVNFIRTKQPPLYVLRGEESRKTGKKLTPESWWNESLQRERYTLKPGELDEWHQNAIELIHEFFFNYIRGYMPMETAYSCTAWGKCQYFDVCSMAPEDRLFMLNSGMYTSNTWSPLKQPTQSMQ